MTKFREDVLIRLSIAFMLSCCPVLIVHRVIPILIMAVSLLIMLFLTQFIFVKESIGRTLLTLAYALIPVITMFFYTSS